MSLSFSSLSLACSALYVYTVDASGLLLLAAVGLLLLARLYR